MNIESLAESKNQLQAFLQKESSPDSVPDNVYIDAQTPDFYDILNVVGETFGTYRGEMRAPLHITLLNIEKVPFEPLEKLWRTIVKNEYYFGNYDFQLYAKGGKHCVNVGRVAISDAF
jgi:hypothetical protein